MKFDDPSLHYKTGVAGLFTHRPTGFLKVEAFQSPRHDGSPQSHLPDRGTHSMADRVITPRLKTVQPLQAFKIEPPGAMIIVSAIGSCYGQKRSLSMADLRSFFCWPAWQVDVIQQILEQFLRPCSKKSLGCSSPLAVSNEEVVNGGQSSQLPVSDAMQSVMTQGQVTVTSFHARA